MSGEGSGDVSCGKKSLTCTSCAIVGGDYATTRERQQEDPRESA